MAARQETGELLPQLVHHFLKGKISIPELFMRHAQLFCQTPVAPGHILSKTGDMFSDRVTQLVHGIPLDQELILEMFNSLADLDIRETAGQLQQSALEYFQVIPVEIKSL